MAKDELEVTLTRVIHADLSRREFLRGTGLALGTIGLAACGGGTTTPTTGPGPRWPLTGAGAPPVPAARPRPCSPPRTARLTWRS